MRIIAIVFELLLILGGVVACSGLIVAKKPDAERILAKIAPFQALIGLALIALGIIFFVMLGPVAAFKAIKVDALAAMANILGVLNRELVQAVSAPELKEKMAADGALPGAPLNAAELQKAYVADYARWDGVMKKAGVKIED